MVEVYNFLGSWQLFPEKGTYESGERPKSGIYRIESVENKKELLITHSWITLENEAFHSDYKVLADGELHPFSTGEFADEIQVSFIDSINFEMHFYRG